MAFRFWNPNKPPPPLPPKDEQYSTNKISIASLFSSSKQQPPEDSPTDDAISLPWNFQHHIHVDEGYVGLPPSWLTSAFTEEEIMQIQARRTAVLHGYNHSLRPPSPSNSLYPSVIQALTPASSSTPNLLLSHSLSSSNLASVPSSPLPLPPPLRPASPAPSTLTFSQPQPKTPSGSSFSFASRNILSDLSSASSNIVGAVKSSAGNPMRLFRLKRPPAPPSSFDNSTRKKVHSHLSDETFFAPELTSPDRGVTVISPTSPSSNPPANVAPVWELYSTSTSTANTNSYGHTPRPSTSTAYGHTPRPSTSSSISHSSKNAGSFLSRSRSKSQSSLSSHLLSSTPSVAANAPSSSARPIPSFSTFLPSSAPSSTTIHLQPQLHRPPHLEASLSQSESLASIPEASPAPGAVVPTPGPPPPPVFAAGKGSLKRKPVPTLNDSSPSRKQQGHHANSSIASTSASSQSRKHLANVGSSSHSHKHTASNSSQKSTSSTKSNQSTTSTPNSQTHSISASSDAHKETPLPMLSLSLPRLSLSLPFGEGSLFGESLVGGSSLEGESGFSSTSAFGQAGSSSSTGMGQSRWQEPLAAKTVGLENGRSVPGMGMGTRSVSSFNDAGVYKELSSGASSTSNGNIPSGSNSDSSSPSGFAFDSVSSSTNATGNSNPVNGSTSKLPPPPPPKPIPIPKSSTAAVSTLPFPSALNLSSSSAPNPSTLSSFSMSTSLAPPTTSTQPPTPTTPISTPPTPRLPNSPSRRRRLPSSKPYPGYPVPALPSSSGSKEAGITKLIPVPPTPFSPFRTRPLPPPLPVPPLSILPVAGCQPTTSTTTSNGVASVSQQQQPNPAGLLSPPPQSAMLSPPLSALSAAQSPNSAELWSEIAQMMDPGMLSAIPGLDLRTALPETVRDVVRRAGEGGLAAGWPGVEGVEGKKEEDKGDGRGTKGKGGEETLVGDLVGPSPPVSGGLPRMQEGSSTSRAERWERADKEDETDEDDSEDEDEDVYDGVVQSASVVIARHPHSPLPPFHALSRLQPQPQPALPRVIEPLRPVGRPRLVNVNVNGLAGAEQVKALEEKKEDVEGTDVLKKNRDSRSDMPTIVPPSGQGVGGDAAGVSGVNGQNSQESKGSSTKTIERPHHRPPSMKLVQSNGIPKSLWNGVGVESATEGGNSSPSLSYYLDDTESLPPPLSSPGSALGSPLDDVDEGLYSSRRLGFEDGYEFGHDEYRLGYQNRDARQSSRIGEDEADIYAAYAEDQDGKGGKKGFSRVNRQSRPLPLPVATPSIILNDGAHSLANDDDDKTRISTALLQSSSSGVTDISPAPSPFRQRYRGWVSTLVAPLSEFIDEAVDPRDHYLDLAEIAEGESGSVYAARLNRANAKKLKLGEVVRMQDLDDLGLRDEDDDLDGDNDDVEKDDDKMKLIALKSIALVPSGTPKLVDLQKELTLMKGLWHSQVLTVDAVYVDLVEDSVWLRMELMERSLADVIVLVESGLVLQERTIARFASDALLALEFLLRHNIAHRDVRSDNMLINNQGILKLADLSNAVRVTPTQPLCTDVVGVPFWQAPELLLHNSSSPSSPNTHSAPTVPPYDPLKLDVWSLGSTVWEMAETVPPFFNTSNFEDRWPPLSQPGLYSPAFHEFLRMCSEPAKSRPSADELLNAPFINNACGRPVIAQLLAQCRTIEWALQEGKDDPS